MTTIERTDRDLHPRTAYKPEDSAFIPSRRHRAATLTEALTWYHFVPLEGPAGQAWFIEFQDSGAEEIAFEIDRVVAILRRGKQEDGSRRLAQCRQRQLMLKGVVPASIDAMLEEAYHGALAYIEYRAGDFGAARQAIQRAQDAVNRAIEFAPYLLLFLIKVQQLMINEARIARRLRCWADMWHLIDQVRLMARGTLPLGNSSVGPVVMDDLYHYYRRVEPYDSFDRQALKHLLDHRGTVATYDQLALSATMSPFVVVSWI